MILLEDKSLGLDELQFAYQQKIVKHIGFLLKHIYLKQAVVVVLRQTFCQLEEMEFLLYVYLQSLDTIKLFRKKKGLVYSIL